MTKKSTIRLLFVLFWVVLAFSSLHLPNMLKKESPHTINLFTWGDYFEDESIIEDFEAETGIKVNLHYYTSNEEMRVKLLANKGEYDLVIPSDYAVTTLIRERALKPLDHSRLHFLDAIAKPLMGLDYDPENRYCIPNTWEIYGLGVDREAMEHQTIHPSLQAVFDESLIDYKLSMTPDPGEAIVFASHYLFGPVKKLNPEQASQVRDLLAKQKGWVEAYADYRAKYLIQTKNCPLALVRSSLIWQIGKEHDFMEFIAPEDGTFITIENLAIPKESKKDDLVYQLINFLYRPDVQGRQIGYSPVYPVVKAALEHTDEMPPYYEHFHRALERSDYVFFRRLLSEEEIRNLWVDVKSSNR